MIEFLNKNLKKYIDNNRVFKPIDPESDNADLKAYQSSLSSNVTEIFDNKIESPINVSPLNNINFSKAIYTGIDNTFEVAAYYLLNSLKSETNNFLFDKDKLAMLFKSNIGITDLPYSLVLYFGALHYWNKNFNNNNTVAGSDFYATPNILDWDDKEKIFDISINGTLSPIYGFEYKKNKLCVYPSIRIISDANYRKNYKSNFIPKFGYGTYSSFMNKYYNFIADKRGNIVSGYDNTIKPFHIYGAENGFVKSFKTYDADANKDINFMGHYTILKNNYGFQSFPTEDELVNDFKNKTSFLIPETLGTITNSYGTDSGMLDVYKIYCKLKTCYLYNAPNFSTSDKVLRTIQKLNAIQKTPITYENTTIKCGILSYLVYNAFFSKTPGLQFGKTINLKNILNSLGMESNFFDNIDYDGDDKTLLKFLMFYWDMEKKYILSMRGNFDPEKVNNDNFVVLLYPSHGGNSSIHKCFNKANFKITSERTINLGSGAGIYSREQPGANHVNENTKEFNATNGSFKNFSLTENVNKTFNKLDTQNYDNTSEKYMVFNTTSDLIGLNFDNKSLIEGATKVLWYDTSYEGTNLFIRDNVNEKQQSELARQTYLTMRSYAEDKNINFFSNVYKQKTGDFELAKKNDVTIQELYEIIDLEKFEYFESAFINFVTRYSDTQEPLDKNNGNFTFQTLMKAISTISENDIKTENIKELTSNLDSTDLIYLLNGYSSYNYYFCSKFKISALINASLTQAQYTKNEGNTGTFSEFLSQKLLLNNYSTIGAVSHPVTQDIATQYHRFIFRPDVILNNTKISDLTIDNPKVIAYYLKKMIFGDFEIPKYVNITQDILRQFVTKTINLNKKDSLGLTLNKELVMSRVDYIFRFLDIEFNEYTKTILHVYINDMFSTNPLIGTNINDFDKEIQSYFLDLMKTLYNNSISGVNLFLLDLKDKIEKKTDPNGSESLYKKINTEDNLLDVKVKTYYNIKNIYDKYLSYQTDKIAPIQEKYGDVNLSVDTGEFSNTQGMLFYNYLYKDISLTESTKTTVGEVSIFDKNTPKHLVEYTQMVDRANNDIGGKILIDVIKLSDDIKLDVETPSADNSALMSKSVFSIFDTIAHANGFILHPINSFVDRLSTLKKELGIKTYAHTLFGVHTTTDRVSSNPAFILQWMDQTSSIDDKRNGISQERSLGNSFALDIDYKNMVVNENGIPDDLKNGQVTSFIVDFTNKNQNMFKNIQLNTSEFTNTEESINAVVNLGSNKGGEQMSMIASGNLFRMMETRSYTCQIESMGNVMIQPLTYFYLKNVPLFRGAYWITNVDHKISTNGMTTTFKGVRQPIITKTSNEKEILKQIEKTLEAISKNSQDTTTGDYTIGTVTQDRNQGIFGTFYQQTTSKVDVASYDGLSILYSLIYSEFGSVTDMYKLFVALLYNRAKYWSQTELGNVKPANVVKYMVDMALNLETNYAGFELKKYFDEKNSNNQGSLQIMIKKFRVDQQNPICVLLNAIAKCTTTADVNKLLIPTNLQQQKLKITTASGKNVTSEGTNVFLESNKVNPKIDFKNLDTEKDYRLSWQSYNIIYMNNILTEGTTNSGSTTIYDINVNNENIKEYQYLNTLATNSITAGNVSSTFSYLGCFDKNKGIVFVGRPFDEVNADKYLSTQASGTKLLSGKGNLNVIKSSYSDLPLVQFSPSKLPIKDFVEYIKSLPIDTNVKIATVAKAINEQGGKRKSNGYQLTGFNNNYYGVQTDSGHWKTGSEYIAARTRTNENQTGKSREFAVFKTWQDGAQFVVSTVQRLGLYVGGTPNRQQLNPYYKKRLNDSIGWANTYFYEWVANGQPFTNEVKNNLITIYDEAKNLLV